MLNINLSLVILTCTLTSCLTSPDTLVPTLGPSTPTARLSSGTSVPKPTVIKTPIPSPTPPPRYFTEDFNSIPAHWSTIDTLGEGVSPASIDGGLMRIRLDRPYSWSYQLFDRYEYGDVRVDAYFEPQGTEPSSTGIFCRFSKEAGWYEFTLSRQGTYSVLLGMWLTEDLSQYTPIVYDESEYIKPEALGFEIGLGCLADELWLYIDGKLIRKVNVARYSLIEGKIGLAVASFENAPIISTFDWFKASTP